MPSLWVGLAPTVRPERNRAAVKSKDGQGGRSIWIHFLKIIKRGESLPVSKHRHHILGEALQRGHDIFVGHPSLRYFKNQVVGAVILLRPANARDQVLRIANQDQIAFVQIVIGYLAKEF